MKNSKNQYTFSAIAVLAALSSAPSLQAGDENKLFELASSNAVTTNVELSFTELKCSTVSFVEQVEQYVLPVDYKSKYKKITASQKFKDAYYGRSLGENILIEE